MRVRNVILRLVLAALLLYALCGFAGARRRVAQQREANAGLERTRQELLMEREALLNRLAMAEDPKAMRRLAWEKLRMTFPDETVFVFTSTSPG